MRNRLKVDGKEKRALRTGLTVGFPQCLWFELVTGLGGLTRELVAALLPWESTLPWPYFEEPDGSDIRELITLKHFTKADLADMFPDRIDDANKYIADLREDPGLFSELLEHENNLTRADYAAALKELVQSAQFSSLNGLYLLCQHTYPVKETQKVLFDPDLQDGFVLPAIWPKWRKDEWRTNNPNFRVEYDKEITTLWSTIFSTDGMVWYNGKHWYQNRGELPACFYVADMVDRQPVGVGEDMLPYIFTTAVSETEGMDQVRKGTGTVTFVTEGAMKNPSRLGREMSKANGVVVLKRKFTPEQALKILERKPNTTYLDFSDRQRDQMKNVHNIHPAVMGQFGGRQSDVAKRTEIDYSMLPQTPYVDNYTSFTHNISTKLCSFFPFVLNEQQVIQIEDELGQPVTVTVNETKTEPGVTGLAKVVANDLTSSRYRIVASDADDSETSREEQMKEFASMLEAIGNTLLQLNPMYMAKVLASWPNRYAKEAGKAMLEAAQSMSQQKQAETQAELDKEKLQQQTRRDVELMKVLTPRVMLRTDPAGINEAPEAFRVFMEWWARQQEQAKQVAAGQGQPQQLQGQQGQQPPQQQIPGPMPVATPTPQRGGLRE
jgi:hypothetical protein